MNNKKIKKGCQKLFLSTFKVDYHTDRFKDGILYTLYSDKFNLLKVGFAENDRVLETILSSREFILLDRKKGGKKDLILLINTLNELDFKSSDNLYFNYSSSLMKHLSTLGWPVGRSLYKPRKIKKTLVFA